MKKLSIFASLLLGLIALAACSTDRDDNPVLVVPSDGFALYAPGIAANVIDLDGTSTLTFQCNQPDYGYTAPITYLMQFSIDGTNWEELSTTSNDPSRLLVNGNDLAVLITNAYVAQGKLEDDFPLTTDVYARVRAYLTGSEENTQVFSDVVQFKAFTSFALPEFTMPEHVYFIGDYNGWNWETAKEGVQIHSNTDNYWRLIYIGDSGFKINWNKAWDGNDVGFDKLNSVTGGKADVIISNGGNIGVTAGNEGWYLVRAKITIVGRTYQIDLAVEEPKVYLIGPASPNQAWDAAMDNAIFTVPTTKDGEFVSPELRATPGTEAGGCLRAYCETGVGDWWQSEFMVYDGKIVYRATGGDQERVASGAGQKLYLNFTTDEGRVE